MIARAGSEAKLGRRDDAWHLIRQATTAFEKTTERWCDAEVTRVAGELALKSAKTESPDADAYFERALTVARQQQAKSWELRAAMSMARLWHDNEARDLLALVYGWFTEDFETHDLKVKKLLDELGA
jgi:predicted ATPase